jgi:hypothetical protein
LVGEKVAEELFSKIEIILLEDWFMYVIGTFILLSILLVGVSDYIEIQSRVIKKKVKKRLCWLHSLLKKEIWLIWIVMN